MAQDLVTERPLAQEGTVTGRGGSMVRVFDVVAASGIDAVQLVGARKNVAIGEVFTNAQGETPNDNIRCRSLPFQALSPTPIGGVGLWKVTANYADRDDTDDSNSGREPTPDGDKVYNWSRAEQTVPVEVDNNGNAIANSKGEPYDPRLTKTESNRFCRVRWYQTSVNLNTLFRYDDAINSKPFTIQGVYNVDTGACWHHGVDPIQEDTDLWYLEALLEFRPDGLKWDPYDVPDYTIVDGKRQWLDGNGEITTVSANAPPTINSFSIATNLRDLSPLEY
ncbi:MAG: hypothetical protein AAGI54_00685 [Planctomycetota bacterium]